MPQLRLIKAKAVRKHGIERYVSTLIRYRVFFNIKLKFVSFVFNNEPNQ